VATGLSYEPSSSDVGSTLDFIVHAKNSIGEASADATTGVVTGPPRNIEAPVISGPAIEGGKLTASRGVWAGTEPIEYKYEWRRCSHGSCSPVATGLSYEPSSSDVGSTLEFVVKARNSIGEASATSPETAIVAPRPPSNIEPPVISGTAEVGQALTASTGSWSGTPPIEYTYQWQRCKEAKCTAIPGATHASYTASAEDVGGTLEVTVTAKNTAGSASSTSAPTGPVRAAPPVNVEPPTISGTAREGQTLTASTGSWTGTPPLEYTYQWESCDSLGGACLPVEGATSSTFVPGPAETGDTLRVIVTASNTGGSASEVSGSTEVIEAGSPPVNVEPPTITGTASVGDTLNVSTGSWSGSQPITYRYQWQRCSVPAVGPIIGPDELTFPEGIAVDASGNVWISNTYSGQIIELNSRGQYLRTAGSKGTEPGELQEPEGIAIDPHGNVWVADFGDSEISEFSDEGAFIKRFNTGEFTLPYALAVDAHGHVWLGEPVHQKIYEFSESGGLIRQFGTEGSEPGQFGFHFPFGIAVNDAGDVWVTDTVNNRVEEFSESGEYLTTIGSAGTGDGQFEHPADVALDSHGDVWVLDNATSRIEEFDSHGQFVTQLSSEGSGPGQLKGPDALAIAPNGKVWVADSGNDRIEQFNHGNELPATECEPIEGATSSTYTATNADLGLELQAVVTAENAAGEASATALSNTLVTAGPEEAPSLLAPPTIGGRPVSGRPSSASTGSWTGTAPIDFSYQWESCDALGESCIDIPGAEAATYTPTVAEVGLTLRVTVTARNRVGEESSTSEASTPVEQPPTNVQPPTVSGVAEDEQTLTATTGIWEGTAPLTYSYQWQSCKPSEESCANIAGATGSTYAIAHGDVGHTLRVIVTASNAAAETASESEVTATVIPSPPVNVVRPTISGKDAAGQTLTSSVGTWKGTPPLAFTYQWERCGPEGEECEAIAAATGPTHQLEAEEVSDVLRLTVTAENTVTAVSALASFNGTPPLDRTPPVILGVAEVRHPLTALNGSWGGTLDIEYTYQWQRCDAAGGECTNIAGATGVTYTPVEADAGTTLRVLVSASSLEGTSTSISAVTPVVTEPLENLTAPTIAGTLEAGRQLTIEGDTWGGPPPIALSYEWQRCQAGEPPQAEAEVELECTAIPGATASTYTVGAGDVGHELQVIVTASSGASSLSVTSAQTEVVGQATPVNDILPSVIGAPNEGGTLAVDPGSWTGMNLTFAYQWEQCNAQGEKCTPVAGATGEEYEVPSRHREQTIRVVVAASNSVGSSAVASLVSAPIRPPRTLTDSVAPSISGAPQVGVPLQADQGAWSGSGAISYAYQWQLCEASSTACTAIAGATAATFTPVAADQGKTLAVSVTATDSNGSASAVSPESEPVAGVEDPAPVAAPTISGAAEEGGTLTASAGTWLSGSPVSYSYQWLACDESGASCSPIAGATASSYTPDSARVGGTVKVVVSATNTSGASSATSAPSAVITSTLANVSSPTITETGTQEPTYTASPGLWSSGGPITYSYQWRRCDSAGAACQDIPGASASTYTLTSVDATGVTLEVAVTASNPLRALEVTSTPVTPSIPAGNLWIAGVATVGGVLSAQDPALVGGSAGDHFQWRRCDAEGSGCADITGASSSSYTVQAADVGSSLIVVLSPAEGAPVSSAPVSIGAPQLPESPPTIEVVGANAIPGVTLRAPSIDTHGSEPTAIAYQWRRCNAEGAGCANIAGATASSYVLEDGDVGSTLRVALTYSNSFGEATAVARPTGAVADSAPVLTVAPTIAWQGSLEPGTHVSVSNGAWAGDTPISFAYQWELCAADGSGCEALSGATGQNLTVEPEALGHSLRVTVTASNGHGSSSRVLGGGAGFEVASPSGAPAPVLAPSVGGTAKEGDALSANRGIWTNAPSGSEFSYQWLRCFDLRPTLETSSGSFDEGRLCEPISGATQQTYTAAGADTGRTLAVEVTVKNSLALTGTAVSAQTSEVQTGPPVNLKAPRVTGEAVAGHSLSASEGVWRGAQSSTAYQWQQCDESGQSCVDLPGATGTGLAVTEAMAGSTLRVAVTVTGPGGQRTEVSSASEPVASASEVRNEAPPVISGTAMVGAALTVSNGEWTGTGPIGYTYQWQRCDSEGAHCAPIAGATHVRYVPISADTGSTLDATVTATNGAGSATSTAAPTNTVVAAGAPMLQTAPTLPMLSTPRYGEALLAQSGSWSGGPEVVDQWQRCDPTNIDPETKQPRCADIEHATGPLYTPTSADIAFRLRVEEIATNPAGTASTTTAMTSTVAAGEVSDEGGRYSGALVDGQTIAAESTVTTTPTLPSVVKYTFTRKEAAGRSHELQSGSSPRYTLTGADVGSEIAIRIETEVTAPGNGARVYAATHTITTPRVEGILTDRAIPTISGAFATGALLTAAPGRWAAGRQPVSYSYQWERCEDTGANCVPIPTADEESHTLAPGDAGVRMRVIVTADDGRAAGTESSEATPVIETAAAPINETPPTISGSDTEGAPLVASPGEWSAEEPITYIYQWNICREPDTPCSTIAGAVGAEYTPSAVDVGAMLQVEVTAVAGTGRTSAASAATQPIAVGPAPVNLVAPQLTLLGPATSEAIIAANGGEWTNLDPETATGELGYQWERCAPDGSGCHEIPGANGQVYDAAVADVGSRIRLQVTATNGSGATSAYTQPSPEILGSRGSARNAIVYVDGENVELAEASGAAVHTVLSCAQAGTFTEGCAFLHPTISPNGQMIAVEVRPKADAPSCPNGAICPDEDNSPDAHVVLLNYDGSEVHTLPTEAGQPVWSPEGTSLIVTHTSEALGSTTSQLETVNFTRPDSPTPIAMPEGVESTQSGSFSEGGSQLAFVGKSALSGKWSIYVGTVGGGEATEIAFPGITNTDDPQLLVPTREGEEDVVFSATSDEVPASSEYGGTQPRSLYIGTTNGSEVRRLTPAGTDFSSPRVATDAGTIFATERTPAEGGGLVTTMITTTRNGHEPRPVPSTGHGGSEASPPGPSNTYGPEERRGNSEEPVAHTAGATYSQLAREFEPLLFVDKSDGFLPISEDWMLKLAAIGSEAKHRTEICAPTCVNKKNPEMFLQWFTPGTMARYPGTNLPDPQEQQTINTIYEWERKGFQHKKTSEQKEFDARYPNTAQLEQRHDYYVLIHVNGKLAIDYWYYYTFNYFNGRNYITGEEENCQSVHIGEGFPCQATFHDIHQGDWENVIVVLNRTRVGNYSYEPREYLLSEHSGMAKMSLKEAIYADPQHHHVEVAAAHGDHADYRMCTKNGEGKFEYTHKLFGPPGVVEDLVGSRFSGFDHICSETNHRALVGPPEIGRFAVGGGEGAAEDLAGRRDTEKFSCWKGRFGNQQGKVAKIFNKVFFTEGTSPEAPLRQVESKFPEEKHKLCFEFQSFAD